MSKSTHESTEKLISQAPTVFFLWAILMVLLVVIGLSDLVAYETFIKMLKGSIFIIVAYGMLIGLLIRKGS